MPPLSSSLDLFVPERPPKRVLRTNCLVWCLGWLPTSGLLKAGIVTKEKSSNVGESDFIVIVQIIYDSSILHDEANYTATHQLGVYVHPIQIRRKNHLNLNIHDHSNHPARKTFEYSTAAVILE